MKDEAIHEDSHRVSDTRQLLNSADDLESLLAALESLPDDATPRAAARHWVTLLSRLLGDVAVGVRIVHADTRESLEEMVLPKGTPLPVRDPARLFPAANRELIVSLDGLPEATLHVAPLDGSELGARGQRLVQRAARLVALALRTALRLESARQPKIDGLRAQLIQAEKLASFGRVVANVVHELANPLTSIIAYAEYLGRRARARADLEDDFERIERIRESAERMLGLSRDLISYARPAISETGPIRLRDAVDRALSFCDHELTSRGIHIQRRHEADVPPVRGAFAPLVQVFVNLITNAAHAMDASGGVLVVETAATKNATGLVRVSDTGTGMPEEVLSRVFEPFFTTKGADLGSGLGLVIVHEIVTAHEGHIRAESTPGKGTTFFVELPLFELPESAQRPLG